MATWPFDATNVGEQTPNDMARKPVEDIIHLQQAIRDPHPHDLSFSVAVIYTKRSWRKRAFCCTSVARNRTVDGHNRRFYFSLSHTLKWKGGKLIWICLRVFVEISCHESMLALCGKDPFRQWPVGTWVFLPQCFLSPGTLLLVMHNNSHYLSDLHFISYVYACSCMFI